MMHQQTWNTTDPRKISVATLYEVHAQMVLAYIRPRVSTKEDAEDLLVEVFLAAMQSEKPMRLSENEQLIWLRHVARNKIIDLYRRQGRLPATSSLDEFTEILLDDEECMPEVLALRDAEYAQLRLHLANLPRLQQEVLRLRFAGGLRTQDIAMRLAKSDSAIRMLLSRTLKHLRAIYEHQKGGDATNE